MKRHRLQRRKLSPSMITDEHLLCTDKDATDNPHPNPDVR
jgi:hypothetical protein